MSRAPPTPATNAAVQQLLQQRADFAEGRHELMGPAQLAELLLSPHGPLWASPPLLALLDMCGVAPGSGPLAPPAVLQLVRAYIGDSGNLSVNGDKADCAVDAALAALFGARLLPMCDLEAALAPHLLLQGAGGGDAAGSARSDSPARDAAEPPRKMAKRAAAATVTAAAALAAAAAAAPVATAVPTLRPFGQPRRKLSEAEAVDTFTLDGYTYSKADLAAAHALAVTQNGGVDGLDWGAVCRQLGAAAIDCHRLLPKQWAAFFSGVPSRIAAAVPRAPKAAPQAAHGHGGADAAAKKAKADAVPPAQPVLRELERRGDVEEEDEEEASQARGVSCRFRSRCCSRAAQRGRSAAAHDRATRADMRAATRQATGDDDALADELARGATDGGYGYDSDAAAPAAARPPLCDCTDAELTADFVRFWAAGALSQSPSRFTLALAHRWCYPAL
jgi:hypothetical protein